MGIYVSHAVLSGFLIQQEDVFRKMEYNNETENQNDAVKTFVTREDRYFAEFNNHGTYLTLDGKY